MKLTEHEKKTALLVSHAYGEMSEAAVAIFLGIDRIAVRGLVDDYCQKAMMLRTEWRRDNVPAGLDNMSLEQWQKIYDYGMDKK